MRAFYSTQKHLRTFILGTPEAWQIVVYDLQKQEWISTNGWNKGTLKEAKSTAQEKVAELLGRKSLEMKWH